MMRAGGNWQKGQVIEFGNLLLSVTGHILSPSGTFLSEAAAQMTVVASW
jgi:hypothetical protein